MRSLRPAAVLAVLLAPLLVSLLAACTRSSEASRSAEVSGAVQKHEATRVRVEPVALRAMDRVLTTTTVVESEQEVQVLPRATGVVTALHVEEGDRVEAGDVLAVLDQREAQVAVDDARIRLREAEDNVDKADVARREAEGRADASRLTFEAADNKYQRNVKARLVSEQELEQLENERDTFLRNWENAKLEVERLGLDEKAAATAVERASLELQRSQVALSYTEVRAPFAGVIDSRSIDVGDSLSASTPAFVLTDDESLRAIIHRPQRELALFRRRPANAEKPAGALAEIEISATAEALPGYRFHGEIDRVSPSIDPDSGSFSVTIGMRPAEDGTQLLPGMLLRLEIVTERHPDALVVNKRAVRREGDKTILFRSVDGRAERVEVREGFDQDDLVEVVPEQGALLAAGDLVVVVGNRDLEDGDDLDVVGWEDGSDGAAELATTGEEEDPPGDDAAPSSEDGEESEESARRSTADAGDESSG